MHVRVRRGCARGVGGLASRRVGRGGARAQRVPACGEKVVHGVVQHLLLCISVLQMLANKGVVRVWPGRGAYFFALTAMRAASRGVACGARRERRGGAPWRVASGLPDAIISPETYGFMYVLGLRTSCQPLSPNSESPASGRWTNYHASWLDTSRWDRRSRASEPRPHRQDLCLS